MTADRLTALESKLAFMEDTVSTLNVELAEHGRQLESLRLLCRQIAEQQQSFAENTAGQDGADEPPPHY